MYNLQTLLCSFITEQEEITSGLKERALNEYKAALLMPRKKKKQAKKSANILYSLACYEEDLLKY